MPTKPSGPIGGLSFGIRFPTWTCPCSSSTTWPDGDDEADDLAGAVATVPGACRAGGDADRFDPRLQPVEVVDVLDLERHGIESRRSGAG